MKTSPTRTGAAMTDGLSPRASRMLGSALTVATLSAVASAGGPVFHGPTPYLSAADAPDIFPNRILEDFEDGTLQFGITGDNGGIIGPGGAIDSVDSDDGVIDGNGTLGRDWFHSNASNGVRFTFDPALLGALPTSAGVVWTDGAPNVNVVFEAFDETGTSLGMYGPFVLGDASNSGTTAEDRFFGVEYDGGISAIRVSHIGGGLELDHLQIGGEDLMCDDGVPGLVSACEAESLVVPTTPGTGVFIEVFNGIGGGGAPTPAFLEGRTPTGTTLSAEIDFPRPGNVVSVGNSFDSFFASTTNPPDVLSGTSATNFILRHTFLLRITQELDTDTNDPDIDIRLGVGSDDGFHLTMGNTFLGQAGDRGFTFSYFNVSVEQPGLYPITLLYAANAVGISGLEFWWTNAFGEGLVPQSEMYLSTLECTRFVNFDNLANGTVPTSEYAGDGLIVDVQLGDVAITDANPDDFVPVSAPFVLGDPAGNSATEDGRVVLSFVEPGTTTPATVDLFSCFVIDAEAEGSISAGAYDINGDVLFFTTFDAGGGTQELLEIAVPGIFTVEFELGGNGDAAAIDNICFDEPVAVPTRDLVITDISLPTGVLIGETFDVTYTVTNDGDAPITGQWTDQALLSGDSVIGGDTPQGTRLLSTTLAPGATYTETISATAPMAPGDVFVVVRVDINDSVPEFSGEDNNAAIEAMAIGVTSPADLIVTNIDVPCPPIGEQLMLTYTVQNTGGAQAIGPWSDHIFLSEDGTIGNGDDVQIGTFTRSDPLDVGAMYTAMLDGVIPDDLEGVYMVYVLTDASDAINEGPLGEGNNSLLDTEMVNVSMEGQVSLDCWTELDYAGNGNAGNWVIQGDGLSVTQTVNGEPTFFVSNFDLIESQFRGQFQVLNGAGDDDFIGLVFGFQGLQAEGDGGGYYLFSWKRANQSFMGFGEAGFKLMKITGANPNLWDLETVEGQSEVLFQNAGDNSLGWNFGTPYDFLLTYQADGDIRVVVQVAGSGEELLNTGLINDADAFGPGKVGFYNYSQSQVNYAGFTQAVLLPPVADAGGPYELSASVQSVTADGSLSNDPDFQGGMDNGINTYQWDLGNDGIGTGGDTDAMLTEVNAMIDVDLAITKGLTTTGSVELKLDVTDLDGLAADDITTITYANAAPTADAESFYGPVSPGESVTLTGTADDADLAIAGLGEVIIVEWDGAAAKSASEIGDGFASSANATVSYEDVIARISEVNPNRSAVGAPIYLNVADAAGVVTTFESFIDLATPDLFAEISPLTTTSGLAGEDTFDVSWIVRNDGAADATGTWSDRIYASTDTGFDAGSDILLGTFPAVSTLAQGEMYANTQTLTVPSMEGAHFIIVVPDGLDEIEELQFDGDFATTSNLLTAIRDPNLLVTSVIGPITAVPGSSADFRFTVQNSGNENASGPWSFTIVASTDAVQGNGDDIPVLSSSFAGSIAAGQSRQFVETGVAPAMAGEYFVFVCVDSNNDVAELDEGDNCRVSNDPFIVGAPDLIIASEEVPTTGTIGQPFTIGWTTQNADDDATAVGPWTDRVYLSLDSIFDGEDTEIGAFTRNGNLAPMATYSASIGSTWPLSAGAYFIVIVTDDGEAVNELTNEMNNMSVVGPITVSDPPLPDLEVTMVNGPTGAVGGDAITVEYTVTNTGTHPAPNNWQDALYLSSDGVLDAGDTRVRLDPLNEAPLAPGASYSFSRSVTLPVSFDASTAFIIVRTDENGTVEERFEDNNTGVSLPISVTPTPAPDLLAFNVSGPGAATFGDSVTVNWEVRNDGNETAGAPWSDLVFLSTDATLEAGDRFLGSVPRDADVPEGGSYMASGTFDLPLDLQTTVGNYFFIVAADGFLGLTERNETNNNSASSGVSIDLPPLANLQVQGVVSTMTAEPGQPVTVSFEITNTGAADASGEWLNEIRLIPDDGSRGEGSVVAVTAFAGTIPSGGSSGVQNAQFVLPDLGSVAVVAAVETDVDGQILESNEADNTGTGVMPTEYLRPDLMPVSMDQPSAAFADDAVRLTIGVDNTGTGRARPFWVDAVFLSFDDQPGNDILLGIDSQTAQVLAGQSYAQVIDVFVPSDLQGDYWFVAQIDRDQRVLETDETNNILVADAPTDIVQPARPDLLVETVVTPADALSSSSVELMWSVRNDGAAEAGGFWVDRVFLSSDTVLDNNDIQLGSFASANPLMPGESYTLTRNVTVPSMPTDSFIIVRADANNQVNEGLDGGELNNASASMDTFAIRTFTATADADITSAGAGTPTMITGRATIEGTSDAAPFVELDVRVVRSGFLRRIAATTDVNGDYAVTFQPSPTEGGFYEVAAGPRHVNGIPASDSFTIWSMTAGPNNAFVTATPNIVSRGTFQLRNQGSLPITGVNALVSNVPEGVDVQVMIDSSRGFELMPNATVPIEYEVLATEEMTEPFLVEIDVMADQPAMASFDLNLRVFPALPNLTVLSSGLTNGQLSESLVRGDREYLEFSIRNDGGAPTGPLQVQLPSIPWVALSTPMSIAPLQPGQTRTVVLRLDPPMDLEFGTLNGTFVVTDGSIGATVPFRFTIVSDQVGSLEVYSTDEFTYYDTSGGLPPVTGASVEVRNPINNALVAQGLTELDGRIRFDGLTEGIYNIRVSASGHGVFNGSITVPAADVAEIEAFLPRQVVNYTWSVIPIDFEDEYRITIEAEFETNVPAPVVVIEPASVDLEGVELPTQIDYTITNHGLITADNVRLEIGESDSYDVIPLVEEIGDLAGMSSVVVPVIIVPAPDRGGNPCDPITVFECHNLTCGDATYTYCGPSVIYTNMCPPAVGPGGGFPISGGGFPGGPAIGTNGIVDGPAISWEPTQSQPIACDPCIPRCAASGIGCIPGAGCPAGLALCAGTFDGSSPGGIITSASGCVAAGLNCAIQLTPLAGQLNCICNVLRDCALCREIGAGGSSLIPCSPGDLVGTIGGLIGGAIGRGTESGNGSLVLLPPTSDIPEVEYYNYYYYAYLSSIFPLVETFGDIAWIEPISMDNIDEFQAFVFTWESSTQPSTENGERISNAERDVLMTLVPSYLTPAMGDAFIARWNRSLDYYDQGIMTEADLPAGFNPDFIDFEIVRAMVEFAAEAEDRAIAEQFDSISDALQYAEQTLVLDTTDGGDGVCATVRIQLDQQVTVTRTAFQAELELENATNNPLESIGVTIRITDEFGDDATNRFGIFPPTVVGALTAVDGTGTLPGNGLGTSTWIILPTNEAAPEQVTEYFVSGSFQYAQGGTVVTVPLAPASIQVLPDPSLQLKYYLETLVFADDPFTLELEPSIPFNLGLLVKNNGAGTARNLTITSSQPEIVENDRGLLIDFDLIGTEVGTEEISPSLTVNLGDIGPDATNTARWLMVSTLQGEFVSYSASFEHITGLGDPRLSLIESVDIFGLNHVVMDATPMADVLPDFLTNDFPDPRDLPDRVHLSNGDVEVVEGSIDPFFTSDLPSLTAQISAETGPSWNYIRIEDPFDGSYRLATVTRSDGTPIITPYNAWQTSRIDRNSAGSPVERFIHIFDNGGSGTYDLTFSPDNTAPQTLAIQSVVEHDSVGEIGLALVPGEPASEPREGGIRALLYTFDEPIEASTFNAVTVIVDGVDLMSEPVILTGITETVTLRAGDTVGEIRFDPPLPTGARYCIQLAGVTDRAGNLLGGGSVRLDLAALPGDATGDRRVNNTDIGGIASLLGTDPIDPSELFEVRSDINADGRITMDDVNLALDARGGDARFVTNPCLSREDDIDDNPTKTLDGDSYTVLGALGQDTGAPIGTDTIEEPIDAADHDSETEPTNDTIDATLRFAIGDASYDFAIEPNSIALFDASCERPVDSLLGEYGFEMSTVIQLPERGWWVAAIPSSFNGAAERSSLLGLLAKNGLYASSILRSADGGTRAATMPELLVRFRADTPGDWNERVIAELAGHGASFEPDAFGLQGVYRIDVSTLDGETVIALANRFSERRDVLTAEANMLAFAPSNVPATEGTMPATKTRSDIAVLGESRDIEAMIASDAFGFTGFSATVDRFDAFAADGTMVCASTGAFLRSLAEADKAGVLVTHTDASSLFPSRFIAERYKAMAERGITHIVPASASFPSGLASVATVPGGPERSAMLAAASFALRVVTPEREGEMIELIEVELGAEAPAELAPPSKGVRGDFDGDGSVTVRDFAIFVTESTNGYDAAYDINADGRLDEHDLSELLSLQRPTIGLNRD